MVIPLGVRSLGGICFVVWFARGGQKGRRCGPTDARVRSDRRSLLVAESANVQRTWTISAPSSFCLENPGTRWFVLLAKTGR